MSENEFNRLFAAMDHIQSDALATKAYARDAYNESDSPSGAYLEPLRLMSEALNALLHAAQKASDIHGRKGK